MVTPSNPTNRSHDQFHLSIIVKNHELNNRQSHIFSHLTDIQIQSAHVIYNVGQVRLGLYLDRALRLGLASGPSAAAIKHLVVKVC